MFVSRIVRMIMKHSTIYFLLPVVDNDSNYEHSITNSEVAPSNSEDHPSSLELLLSTKRKDFGKI